MHATFAFRHTKLCTNARKRVKITFDFYSYTIYIVVFVVFVDSYDFTLAAATRGSAPASASVPNVLMAKIQLAKKTVAHAHAKCQLWTAQAGGRADGETERRTDDQTISQRPSTGPETQRCRQGEVSLLLLLLRIDSFMFSLSAENQYFSYFLSYFFRFFVLFVIVFEASFRVWASVIISLRVVAPSDSHFSQRTGQD